MNATTATAAGLALLATLGLAPAKVAAQTAAPLHYYVDCNRLDDNGNGNSPETAWRNLSKLGGLGATSLPPGSTVNLMRGCSWPGMLKARWQGSEQQPILIQPYGSGTLYPEIVASKGVYGIDVTGRWMILQGLKIRGVPERNDAACPLAPGKPQPVGYVVGIGFEPGSSNVTVKNSYITQTSDALKLHGPNQSLGLPAAQFHRILGNQLVDNNFMSTLDDDGGSDDTGASAVVVAGNDNEIAYNLMRGQDACSYDFARGSAATGRDGSAVEVYGGSRNRVHHNQAFDNNTFTELGKSPSDPDGASDNRYAYNLVAATIEDAHFLVSEGASGSRGPIVNTQVLHNTVYLSHPTSFAINCDGGCDASILSLRNNIVWAEGKVGYIDVPTDEAYNRYWRSNGTPVIHFTPDPATSRVENPHITDPVSGDFRLQPGSPAVDIADDDAAPDDEPMYATDLYGTSVPQNAGPDIGAIERTPGVVGLAARDWSMDEAGGSILVGVQRFGGGDGAVSVRYFARDLSAQSGKDYSAKAGTLSWADGEVGVKSFSVKPLNDGIAEGQEWLAVQLDQPSGGAVPGMVYGEVGIVDDDSADPDLRARLRNALLP